MAKMWRKQTPRTLLVGMFPMENSMEVSQKTRTTVWPSNFTPGYLPKTKNKTNKQKIKHLFLKIHASSVHGSIIYNCQDMEAT